MAEPRIDIMTVVTGTATEAAEALRNGGEVTITLPSGRAALIGRIPDNPPCFSVKTPGGVCHYSDDDEHFPTPEGAIEAFLAYEEE